MKNILITIIGVAVVITGIMFVFENRAEDRAGLVTPLGEIIRYTTPETKTSISCGTSSTLLLATSTSRIRATFVNDGATAIYISLGNAAVLYEGIRLNANGGSYEIEYENLFTGAVNCISTSAASSTVSSK